jgi:hypothetical protein
MAFLILIALFLIACIGLVAFSQTPYGQDQFDRLGTWAAEESTRQAGN